MNIERKLTALKKTIQYYFFNIIRRYKEFLYQEDKLTILLKKNDISGMLVDDNILKFDNIIDVFKLMDRNFKIDHSQIINDDKSSLTKVYFNINPY